MATETYFMPGFGIIVDEEDGDEYFMPGFGVVVNNPAAAAAATGGSERSRPRGPGPRPRFMMRVRDPKRRKEFLGRI